MTPEASAVHQAEADHLATTLRRLERKIESLTDTLGTHEVDYRAVKSYMVENRGDIDPVEMYQNELILLDIDAGGAHAMRRRRQLEAMRSSPYFARLDFTPDAERVPESFYIGRHTLQDAEGTAVVDWRAPLGGMYYEAEIGPATYEAPSGRISGRIERKRQIRIEDGRLRFAVDTAEAVRDEVLLTEIGRTTDAHMRSIIATIQREQNAIIRDEADGTLIIQGVAGSGKTSIALHRIAYLLYRRRGRLRAENTAVLSPNKLFAEYVEDVLPELGEEPVVALDLADVARTQLARHRLGFADPVDPVEPGPDAPRERALVKASLAFHRWLEQAVAEVVQRCFEPGPLSVKGCRVGAEELRDLYDRFDSLPVKPRLRAMAELICQRDRQDRSFATTYPRPAEVTKALTSMLTVKSARALYRDLLRRDDAPTTFHPPAAGTLEWADVYPFLLVAARFDGLDVNKEVLHLVVDEMQDHSPTQYAVLREVFRCDLTVLGDVGQALGNTESYSLEGIARLFDGARVMELNRSYRSTSEIMAFASKIRGRAISTIDRHGEDPRVLGFETRDAEVGWIAEEVGRFRDTGSGRLAIVTRSRAQAQDLHRRISVKLDDIVLATGDSRGVLAHDVTVLPVALAKGLEFDDVIVAGATVHEYGADADRSLLYIACTRALHRLTVTHHGPPSPHLPS